MGEIGKIIALIGAVLLVIGILISIFGNFLGWFGNLPGDIKVRREGFSFFFPVTSMILVSIVISLVLWVIRRYF